MAGEGIPLAIQVIRAEIERRQRHADAIKTALNEQLAAHHDALQEVLMHPTWESSMGKANYTWESVRDRQQERATYEREIAALKRAVEVLENPNAPIPTEAPR